MNSERNPITYLSAPTPVRMGDWWFEIATEDHFWIRRRFDVLRRLADPVVRNAVRAAEIGCGNGLLQKRSGGLLRDLWSPDSISMSSPCGVT